MKIRTQILLPVLILFVFCIDIIFVLVVHKNYSLNLDIEIKRVHNEVTVLENTFLENLSFQKKIGYGNEQLFLKEMFNNFQKFYNEQNIFIELWKEDNIIYPLSSEFLDFKNNIIIQKDKDFFIQYHQNLNENENLTLVYRKNINDIINLQKEIYKYFIYINIFILGISAIVLVFIINRITKPITILSNKTNEISKGNYEMIENLKSSKEINELSNNFNLMSSSIKNKILKLEEISLDKQQMIDNLSHELKTPLTSIRGFTEYLLNANISNEEKNIAGEYILSEVDRINNLSKKLLNLSKTKNYVLNISKIDISKLFKNILVKEKNIFPNIIFETKINEKYFFADYDLIYSFLLNCIENAVYASNKEGKIILSAYKNFSSYIISVKDFGVGISKEEQKNIFKAFYRIDKSRSRNYGGSGIGLTLCKQIADAHNADIEILSEINKGTEIKLILQLFNNLEITS